MDKDKQVEKVAAQVFELDHDDQVAIRDALNIKLREVAFQRLERFFKEKGAPVDNKAWVDWHELKFLLGSATQTLEEGEGVVNFIEFTRSAFMQVFTELGSVGVHLQKAIDSLNGEMLKKGAVDELAAVYSKFFPLLERTSEIFTLTGTSHHEWNRLRGHTEEEHSKLMKKWSRLKREFEEEIG